MTFNKSHAASLSLAAALLMAGVNASEAGWSRQGSGTGPRGGTFSSSGSGSCSGRTCSSNQAFVGPNGGVTTRSGSKSCSGGSCSSNAVVTGPAGRSATRSGTITRY